MLLTTRDKGRVSCNNKDKYTVLNYRTLNAANRFDHNVFIVSNFETLHNGIYVHCSNNSI